MIVRFFDENFTNTKGVSYYLDPNVPWKKNIENYDVGLYTDRLAHTTKVDNTKVNFAWILEPPVINRMNYIRITDIKANFKYIFGSSKELQDTIDNFIYIPLGGTWIKEQDFCVYQKRKIVSCFLSMKKWAPGHVLRHQIYNEYKNSNIIDFYGAGAEKKVNYKLEGLKNYMYSVTIENSIEDDYFTEKIIDCFLTGTIPIYYGTNNISQYFDPEGIIMINNVNDLESKINLLTEDFYLSKIESIRNNFVIAQEFIYPEKIIQKYIDGTLR